VARSPDRGGSTVVQSATSLAVCKGPTGTQGLTMHTEASRTAPRWPAHHPPRGDVDDGGQVEPAGPGADVGDGPPTPAKPNAPPPTRSSCTPTITSAPTPHSTARAPPTASPTSVGRTTSTAASRWPSVRSSSNPEEDCRVAADDDHLRAWRVAWCRDEPEPGSNSSSPSTGTYCLDADDHLRSIRRQERI